MRVLTCSGGLPRRLVAGRLDHSRRAGKESALLVVHAPVAGSEAAPRGEVRRGWTGEANDGVLHSFGRAMLIGVPRSKARSVCSFGLKPILSNALTVARVQ